MDDEFKVWMVVDPHGIKFWSTASEKKEIAPTLLSHGYYSEWKHLQTCGWTVLPFTLTAGHK